MYQRRYPTGKRPLNQLSKRLSVRFLLDAFKKRKVSCSTWSRTTIPRHQKKCMCKY